MPLTHFPTLRPPPWRNIEFALNIVADGTELGMPPADLEFLNNKLREKRGGADVRVNDGNKKACAVEERNRFL